MSRETVWNTDGEAEVLTFNLQGEVFALQAGLVREIMDMTPETAVPGAPPFVSSVINFRGKVIPLADLRLAFDMQAADSTIDSRIVVIEVEFNDEPTLVGLVTDKVNEVATLARRDSEAAPSVGMRWRPDYIQCLVKREGDFVIVPDLQAIFASQSGAPQGGPLSLHS